MSQDNKKSMVMYQGDGSNNVFAVPMTKGKYGTISVAFVRRGLDNYEYNPTTWTLNGGLFAWANASGNNFYTNTDIPAVGATVYNQYGVDTGYTVSAVNGTTITITDEGSSVLSRNSAGDVDENTLLTWTGDVLNVGDYIVIERTTVRKQPYEFPNNQKHIERSDDNLERQIQEVADAADRALKLDPTYSIDSDKMNPIEWLQTIVRCKDLTVRGLRFANNVLQYSKDDPEKPESEKTWYSLLNTDGITNVRERYDVGTDTYYFEYSTDGGSNWKDVGEIIRHNGLQGRDSEDCHPISAITDLQKNLDNKINKQQGAENAGKILKVDNDGNIIASSEAAGLASVNHDDTLEGAGTESIPLAISKTVLDEIAGKQDTLTTNQLAAVNSGITSAKVASYDAYAGEISAAKTTADKADNAAEVAQQTANLAGQEAAQALSGLADKVNIAQGTANAGKILTVGDDGNIELADGASGAGRNIGDIFWTTRTDSALNGAVEANGAQYNFADVNGGDNNIQTLLEAGKLPYVSITEFNAMVAKQGGCDSFGFDENLYCWDTGLTTYYTKSPTPKIGDQVYYSSGRPASFVLVSDINSIQIEVNGNRYTLTRNAENDILATYFKVPKKLGRVLVRSQKPTADNDYTWFSVYSDGWVEQGKFSTFMTVDVNKTCMLTIPMKDTNYIVLGVYDTGTATLSSYSMIGVGTKTTQSFQMRNDGGRYSWKVEGYASASEYTPDKWDYQNVHVERPMVQLFNGATDEAVAKCTEVLSDVAGLKQATDGMIDYVVESQEPTSGNGYTWYRLYKSGWVEQGGFLPNKSGSGTIQLIIPLTSAPAVVSFVPVNNSGTPWPSGQANPEYNYSASSGTAIAYVVNDGRQQMFWWAAGMAA